MKMIVSFIRLIGKTGKTSDKFQQETHFEKAIQEAVSK